MLFYRFGVGILIAGMTTGVSFAGESLNFAKEYVRELGSLEAIRENAERDVTQSASNFRAQMADCIRNGQRYQLELNMDISMLEKIKLPKPVDQAPSTISQFYQLKLDQYGRMMEICSTMLSGPKPGVDYGQLAAEMPKISANLDYIDQSLFKASPLVFAALIDQRPDKENHLSHLVISKAERDALVRDINLAFGKKLDQEQQKWGVSAASVLRDYLTKKDYKFADDPW
jgi:hypothetical protein